MKILLMIVILSIFYPSLGRAELSPSDLTQFQNQLSSIISFFAGNLAVMGFIAGILGGRL
jgi:hypothetical protein